MCQEESGSAFEFKQNYTKVNEEFDSQCRSFKNCHLLVIMTSS